MIRVSDHQMLWSNLKINLSGWESKRDPKYIFLKRKRYCQEVATVSSWLFLIQQPTEGHECTWMKNMLEVPWSFGRHMVQHCTQCLRGKMRDGSHWQAMMIKLMVSVLIQMIDVRTGASQAAIKFRRWIHLRMKPCAVCEAGLMSKALWCFWKLKMKYLTVATPLLRVKNLMYSLDPCLNVLQVPMHYR